MKKQRYISCHFLAIAIIILIPKLSMCQFLSMKLAAINPRLDFDIENYILKEVKTIINTDFNSTFM